MIKKLFFVFGILIGTFTDYILSAQRSYPLSTTKGPTLGMIKVGIGVSDYSGRSILKMNDPKGNKHKTWKARKAEIARESRKRKREATAAKERAFEQLQRQKTRLTEKLAKLSKYKDKALIKISQLEDDLDAARTEVASEKEDVEMLAIENNELHAQVQDLTDDNEKLIEELEKYKSWYAVAKAQLQQSKDSDLAQDKDDDDASPPFKKAKTSHSSNGA